MLLFFHSDVIITATHSILLFVVAYFSSIIYARFFMKLFPIIYREKKKQTYVGLFIYLMSGLFLFILSNIVLQFQGRELFADNDYTDNYVSMILSVLAYSFFGIVQRGLKNIKYHNNKPGNFVLYLRRHNSFADQSVLGEVIKGVPVGYACILLIAEDSSPEDWDPFTLYFYGAKFAKSSISLPIYLKSDINIWEEAAIELLSKCQCVVFDISEKGNGIVTEINLIKQHKIHKVIWICDETKLHSSIDWISNEFQMKLTTSDIITYRKSLRPSLIKYLLGILPIIYLISLSFVGISYIQEMLFETNIIIIDVLTFLANIFAAMYLAYIYFRYISIRKAGSQLSRKIEIQIRRFIKE